MAAPRRYVTGPPRVPVPYGLLSAAVVVNDGPSSHVGLGGFHYQTENCGVAHRSVGACFDAAPAPDALDPNDGRNLIVSAAPFTVYALHQCRVPGSQGQEKTIAEAKLAAGEGHGIEEGFAEGILEAATDDRTPTPGTPVPHLTGLAILEEYARDVYPGQPTLHMSPASATILAAAGALEAKGQVMGSKVGSLVAVGGGYATGPGTIVDAVTAGAGERWMWVTGPVLIYRGPVFVSEPTYNLAAPDNEYRVLAQRGVEASAECLLAAVMVQEYA